MTPSDFLVRVLDDGLDFVVSIGGPPATPEARRFLLAVAMQESGPKLDARYQGSPASVPGPARGFWQFEQGGGVTGVLAHPASSSLARQACGTLTVVTSAPAVWRALEGCDLLACAFARLLLWTDPGPIPTTPGDGYGCYMRLWRPGAPHPDTWQSNWAEASTAAASTPVA